MTGLIGVLGGTFDPVHNGHLAVARDARDGIAMDEVRFVINALPPHRVAPAAAAGHRLAMLEAATAGEDRFVVDTRELARTGPSYSVWTLRSLRREFPDASLCWIIGADAWAEVKSWHRWTELSALAHFLVVQRPGWTLPPAVMRPLSRDPALLRTRTAGGAVLREGPAVDVSASAIRCRVAEGGDISDLVPDVVERYIQRHHLYDYR